MPASSSPLSTLYRDDHLVAVFKPAGHVVHRTPLCPEAPAVLPLLRDQLDRFLLPVHRLDRGTCGVLLFALDKPTAADLGEQFRQHRVDKLYLAVVRGWTAAAGVIDHPYVTVPGTPARPAITAFRRLRTCELPIPVKPYASARYSLVEARPLTGRQHQIRRHLKHLSHPLVGDVVHGRHEHNELFRRQFGCHRLLLQAVRLSFRHPASGQPLTIEAELDAELAILFGQLGWPTTLAQLWTTPKT